MEYAKTRIEGTIAHAVAPIGPYVKKLSMGVFFILLSVVCFTFTLLFLTTSLFFGFADYGDLGLAALWTGLITVIIGGIMLGIGLYLFKKPEFVK